MADETKTDKVKSERVPAKQVADFPMRSYRTNVRVRSAEISGVRGLPTLIGAGQEIELPADVGEPLVKSGHLKTMIR